MEISTTVCQRKKRNRSLRRRRVVHSNGRVDRIARIRRCRRLLFRFFRLPRVTLGLHGRAETRRDQDLAGAASSQRRAASAVTVPIAVVVRARIPADRPERGVALAETEAETEHLPRASRAGRPPTGNEVTNRVTKSVTGTPSWGRRLRTSSGNPHGFSFSGSPTTGPAGRAASSRSPVVPPVPRLHDGRRRAVERRELGGDVQLLRAALEAELSHVAGEGVGERLPLPHDGVQAAAPLVHGRIHPKHIGIYAVDEELAPDCEVDQGPLLRRDRLLAAEVRDERVPPRPELAAERRALRWKGARTEDRDGLLQRVRPVLQVRPARWRGDRAGIRRLPHRSRPGHDGGENPSWPWDSPGRPDCQSGAPRRGMPGPGADLCGAVDRTETGDDYASRSACAVVPSSSIHGSLLSGTTSQPMAKRKESCKGPQRGSGPPIWELSEQ